MQVKFKKVPEALRNEIEDLIFFSAETHGIADNDFVLRVEVEKLEDNTYGEIAEHDLDSNIVILRIGKNVQAEKTRKFLHKLVIHEMTHVKQFIKDGLAIWADGEVAFRGMSYSMKNSADYWLAPWEVEARGYEDGIYTLWREQAG